MLRNNNSCMPHEIAMPISLKTPSYGSIEIDCDVSIPVWANFTESNKKLNNICVGLTKNIQIQKPHSG